MKAKGRGINSPFAFIYNKQQTYKQNQKLTGYE